MFICQFHAQPSPSQFIRFVINEQLTHIKGYQIDTMLRDAYTAFGESVDHFIEMHLFQFAGGN